MRLPLPRQLPLDESWRWPMGREPVDGLEKCMSLDHVVVGAVAVAQALLGDLVQQRLDQELG